MPVQAVASQRLPALARRATLAAGVALLLIGPAGAHSATPVATAIPPAAATTGARGASGRVGSNNSPLTSTTSSTISTTATTPKTTPVTTTQTKSTTTPATQTTTAAKPARTNKTAKPPAPKPRAKKKPQPIGGWLGNGTSFPNRALVITVPPSSNLSLGRVHVTENGIAVSGLTLTPLSAAGSRDLGIVLAVDDSSSMSGAPLADVMGAARSLAQQRTADAQLGMVSFNASANLLLPLTSNTQTIRTQLGMTPGTGTSANVPAAIGLALAQLANAKVAAGAVIVISDGVGARDPGGTLEQQVQAAQSDAHIPVFTVGLQGGSSTALSLQQLQRVYPPSRFLRSTVAELPQVLASIRSAVTNSYVIRYRSKAPAGRQVTVSAHVDGLPGTLDLSYSAPTAPKPVSPPVARHPSSRRPQTSPVRSGVLSPWPDFVTTAAPLPVTNRSFWASGLAVLVISAGCALLLALSVLFLVYCPSKQTARKRVGSYLPGDAESDEAGDQQTPVSRGPLAKLAQGGRWWLPFVENVAVARGAHTPISLVKRAAVCGLLGAVFLLLVIGSPLLALLPLLAWPFGLRMLINRAARKQRERFRDLLPLHLQDLAGAMRAGRSVVGAIASVADGADEPIRSELERAVRDEQLGRPLDESLDAVAERMQATDMEQVALIARLNRRSGSNVAEALERVAEGARERADLRREIKALTGQAKMSSLVLSGLPPLLLVGISFLAPGYSHPLFHTTLGIALIGVASLMVLAGWKVMRKITEIEV